MLVRAPSRYRRLAATIAIMIVALLLLLLLSAPKVLSDGQELVQLNAPTMLDGEADLHLLLYRPGHTNEPILSDTTITYTISVNNLGPDRAENIVVGFDIPGDIDWIATSFGAGSSCERGYPQYVCYLADEWDGSAGGRMDIEVVTHNNRHNGNQYLTISAFVTSDTADPDPNNNSATLSTWIEAASDMILTKDLPVAGPIYPGDYITYTLDVVRYYSPPHPALDAMIVDTLPAGVSYIASTFGDNESCTETGGIVTCDLSSDFDPDETIVIVVQVNPDFVGVLTNSATVTTSNPDLHPENNTDAVSAVVMPRHLDFSSDSSGNPLVAGQIVDDEWADLGIQVQTWHPERHPVMVFDSSNPTGGDPDLGTPNVDFGGPGVGSGGSAGMPGENRVPLGNLLIISEDGDSTDPDDDAHGGSIFFDFDVPQSIYSLQLVDINSWNGLIRVRDIDGNWLADFPTMPMGDNSVQTIVLNMANVGRLEVHIHGSGGLANIIFAE